MSKYKLYTAHLAGTSYDGNKKYEMVISQNGKTEQIDHQKKDIKHIILILILTYLQSRLKMRIGAKRFMKTIQSIQNLKLKAR